MTAPLIIGHNTLTGQPVTIDPLRLRAHTLIVGGTGRGKSKLMQLLLRYRFRQGSGAIVLDPAGYLYEDILAYATAMGLSNRLILVNPNEA